MPSFFLIREDGRKKGDKTRDVREGEKTVRERRNERRTTSTFLFKLLIFFFKTWK